VEDNITIQTRFDKIIYELPTTNGSYLYVANPINELLLSSFIKPENGTFIDVGAFIGKHTIRCAKNPNVRVIAIEPNPVSIKLLKRNIFLNNVEENIEIVEAALINEDMTSEVKLILDHDKSKILRNNSLINSSINVNATSFNRLISEYNVVTSNNILLKIDIEGYEFELLKGMREFLINSSNNFKMVCEILHYSSHKTKTINFLKSLNFNLLQVDNENYFIYKNKQRKS